MQNEHFYSVIFGFALGIFFHSFLDFGLHFSALIIFLATASFLVTKFLSQKSSDNRRRYIFLFILTLFSFGFGSLRYDVANIFHNPDSLSSYANDKVVIQGVVRDEPDIGENNQKLTVKADSILKAGATEAAISEKILVSTDLYPEFSYGDRIRAEGKIEKAKNFVVEGEKPFDYTSYLAKDNIFYTVSFAKVTLVGKGEGNFVKAKLFALKNALFQNLRRALPEPHASLAGGLILGGKNAIGKDLEKDFRTAGIIHIIVLSGYNIMIVSQYVMKIFSFLPRAGNLGVGAVSVILFAIMTGGSTTVVRASVMALIALLGKFTGRTNAVNRALFLAGFLMLLHNPKILVFDFSFQLSFLATLGLIHFSPIVERKIMFVTKKFNIREYVVATIATQIIVMPLILYRMGEISIVSLPVNILVLFLIPWTMAMSFITSILAFFGSFVALPAAGITYFLIGYELKVVELFSKLPFASLKLSFFPLWLMAVIYVSYIFAYLKINKKTVAKDAITLTSSPGSSLSPTN
ncbi:MAG: ComEC/Rec2 family competence protein [Candidatus Taylorbacteria bacterium]